MAQINPQLGTISRNNYAAGIRRYGGNASSAATSGPLPADGYQDRERRNKLKQQIYLRWMQDNSNGAHNSANANRLGR